MPLAFGIDSRSWSAYCLGQQVGAFSIRAEDAKGTRWTRCIEAKEQVIQLLKAQSNRILVILDDIDRLSNEQIRYVFSWLLRLRGSQTRLTFGLRQRNSCWGIKGCPKRKWTGLPWKVIQMPIQIPNIQRSDLRNALLNGLMKLLQISKNSDITRSTGNNCLVHALIPLSRISGISTVCAMRCALN